MSTEVLCNIRGIAAAHWVQIPVPSANQDCSWNWLLSFYHFLSVMSSLETASYEVHAGLYETDMLVLESLIEKIKDLLMFVPQVCGAWNHGYLALSTLSTLCALNYLYWADITFMISERKQHKACQFFKNNKTLHIRNNLIYLLCPAWDLFRLESSLLFMSIKRNLFLIVYKVCHILPLSI